MLSKKIKIAISITIINGIIMPLFLLNYAFGSNLFSNNYALKLSLIIISVLCFIFLPLAFFLIKNKKWAWKVAVLLSIFLIICFIFIIIHNYYEYKQCLKTEWIFINQDIIYDCDEYFQESNNLISAILTVPLVIIPALIKTLFPKIWQPLIIADGVILIFIAFILLPLIFFLIEKKKYWENNNLNPNDYKNRNISVIRKALSLILGGSSLIFSISGFYFLQLIETNFANNVLIFYLIFNIVALMGLIMGIFDIKLSKKYAITGIVLSLVAFFITIILGLWLILMDFARST